MSIPTIPYGLVAVAMTCLMGGSLQAAQDDGDVRPLPVVTVEATVPETREPLPYSLAPERPAVFTISRDEPSEEGLNVYFQLGGSAINGEDYAEVPEHAWIPPGASSVNIYIGALHDEVPEGDEWVVLRLVVPPCLPIEPPPPHCYLAGAPDLARVVIHDDDIRQPVVNVVAIDPVATEQSPDLTIPPDVAVFEIARRGSMDIPLEVYYSVRGSADNGDDYTDENGEPLGGLVTIPEGRSSVTLTLFPVDDDLPERRESVVVQLEPIICPAIWPPPPYCYVIGQHPVAEAVIQDNDQPPENVLPRVAIVSPAPGDVFVAPASIDIVAEVNDPDGWVHTVELFGDGQKLDEQSIAFLVAPPPGQDQVFRFRWEAAPVGMHTLSVRATDDRGGRSRSERVSITVAEAPAIPVVNIWATDPFAREEWSPTHPRSRAQFRVRRSGLLLDAPLAVDYEIGGTAGNGEDYLPLPGQVTIPAGKRSAVIDIVPIDDEIPEGVESIVLKLFVAVDVEPPPYLVGRHARAGAVIVDRDHPRPICRSLHDGLVYMCRKAQAGDIFQVQVTDHLGGEWTSIGTVTVDDGAVHFIDPESAELGSRYYRFVPVPVNSIAVDD